MNLWTRTQEFQSNSSHLRSVYIWIVFIITAKRQEDIKILNMSATERGAPAEVAEAALWTHGLLAKFWRWKTLSTGDVLKVTLPVTGRLPAQRGSDTFLSLQGKTTSATSSGHCSVPAFSTPAMEHFQTTTVKHLERLSRREKKNLQKPHNQNL